MKARDPKVTPPRVTTGPILLTGLARCAHCDGAMTLRTGTSKGGEVYRYYSCATCKRMGKTACPGCSIRMDKLDGLVTEHLTRRLFTTERLTELLSAIATQRAQQAAEVDGRTRALQKELSEAETKQQRLYQLVEDALADLDGSDSTAKAGT